MNRVIRATRVNIHLDALRENISIIRSALAPGTAVCAAVKANAYGHGAVPVARTLREEGVEVLGVATPFEGEELREAGDRGRILLLGPSLPEEIPITVSAGLEPMIVDERYLGALETALAAQTKPAELPVHLKVDTGMGRVGCLPGEAVGIARRIDSHPRLKLAGIATHFPVADSDTEEDMAFTHRQAEHLKSVVRNLADEGIDPGIIHAANSGAVALSPEYAFGMARPGISLYGYGRLIPGGHPWTPVMEMKTRISALKKVKAGTSVSYGRTWKADIDTWIATLPVGYADGYSRRLSNRARVLIRGRGYPVVGTICMDQCMVNLGEETDISLYDEVTLFGPDPEGPDAEDLAAIIGTISYEITCGISARVPRVYFG